MARSARYRLRSSVPLSTAVMAIAIVLAGCGGPIATGKGVIPRRADVAIEVSLDRSSKGPWRRATLGLRRIPSYALVEQRVPDVQDVLVRFDEWMSLRGRPRFERDIAPWLGRRGGWAAWDVDDAPPQWMMWAEVTDETVARERIGALLRASGDGDAYHDVPVFTSGTDAFGGHAYYSVWDGKLVLSSRRQAVERSIDAHGHGALEDTGDYGRLRTPSQSRSSIASVYVARHAADVFAKFAGESAPDSVRRQLDAQADAVRNLLPAAIHVGANDAGLYVEAIVAGARLRSEGRIPITALSGRAAGTVLAIDGISNPVREQRLVRRQPSLTTMLTGIPKSERPEWITTLAALSDAVRGYLSTARIPDSGERVDEATIIERAGEFALVMRSDLGDQAAAWRELDAGLLETVDRVLRRRAGIGIERVGFPEEPSDVSIGIDGIPHDRIVRSIATAFDVPPARVARHPLMKSLAAGRLSALERWGEDGTATIAVPAWGLDAINTAAAGGETIGSASPYREAIATVESPRRDERSFDAPRRVDAVAWVDVRRIVHAVVEPFDARASFLSDQQLGHAPGVLAWSWRDGDGAKAVTRTVVALPLFTD